jgi:hypothetical protein
MSSQLTCALFCVLDGVGVVCKGKGYSASRTKLALSKLLPFASDILLHVTQTDTMLLLGAGQCKQHWRPMQWRQSAVRV